MALNIIPIVSVIFTLTSAVGAALWASDIENGSAGSGTGQGSTAKATQNEVEVSLGDDYGKAEVSGKKEL